jgi:hypothetical protein
MVASSSWMVRLRFAMATVYDVEHVVSTRDSEDYGARVFVDQTARYEPRQRGEPGPVGRLVPHPADKLTITTIKPAGESTGQLLSRVFERYKIIIAESHDPSCVLACLIVVV